MNNEAQRIAIAEACPQLFRYVLLRSGVGLCFRAGDGLPEIPEDIFDPLLDLNAAHEMEKVLTSEQMDTYAQHVYSIVARDGVRMTYGIAAPAAQRCEAFLRTLNLWTT